MSFSLGKILRSLWGVPSEEVTAFSKGDSETWKHLERVALAVVEGYHATIENSKFEVLVPRLNSVEAELRGFAYEGAGMGLTLLDSVMPWQNRLCAFLDGPGVTHIYPVHIGVGLALARLRMRPERFLAQRPERILARLDPLLRWLAMDGYGFHEGFFSQQCYVEQQTVPTHLSGYALRAFDQGLGRSLWFSGGADIERVPAIIAGFAPSRHADLWSGVGVACAYAGGANRAPMETLRTMAGPYWLRLAQGAAVSALARQQASNPTLHTDLACEVWCGTSSDQAARLADMAQQDLPPDGAEPAYEIWRQRIEAQFSAPAKSEQK